MSLDQVTQQVQKLVRITPGRHPIVSCYLKLEPRDRARGKYLIKLKNRMKQAVNALPALGFTAAESEAIRDDLDRIQAALDGPGDLPSTQGVAVFASSGLKLFEKVPLPSVHRSRLVVDRSPSIRELLAVEDEVGRLVTVVLDRRGARLFEVTAFQAREILDLRSQATRGGKYKSDRKDAPGAGEYAYQNRIRNEKERHLSTVAEAIFDIDRKAPVHGIVLAGIGADAGGVEPFLHPYLKDRVMGVLKLNLKLVTPAAVHQATLEARTAHEREEEAALVESIREGMGSRWAVNGVGATLHALGSGKVRTLVVNPDVTTSGFRCADTGRLALAEKDCRAEGGAVPVADVIDDAVEEALRQRVRVEVVHSAEAAGEVDGLAALLRFR